MNDELERLLAVQACRDLVLRAAAATDAQDAAALAALFAPDAVLERPNAAPIQGRDAIRRAYADAPAGRLSRHLVTNTLVQLIAPDQARASSLVLRCIGQADAPAGPLGRPLSAPAAVGELHDRFTRSTEGWRIQHRRALFTLCWPAAAR